MTNTTLLSPRFQFNVNRPFRPSVSKVQRDLIEEVQGKFNSHDYQFQPTDCPCGAAKDTDIVISEIDRYGFNLCSVLCPACGTVRFDPYLDEASLGDFYSRIYRKMYGLDIQDKGYDEYFAGQASYAEKILSVTQNFLKPDSWICEVGCGGGGGLKYFQDKGFNVAGCDYDVEALAFAKQQGVANLSYGGLESIAQNHAGIKFDLIYLHHVFEHLSDPIAFLQDCKNYLSPEGKVVAVIPNVHEIDRIGTLPAIGNLLMYLHIAHKYNFSLEGMKRLSQKAGFSATRLEPDPTLVTRGSSSPEFWIQMSTSDLPLIQESQKPDVELSKQVGQDVLKYFQRTEKLYSLGLCIGQVRYKVESMKSPEKIIHKLQKVFGMKKTVGARR
jgi:2-polyprenyl-3-methyl-5-hydroxy-6-metoxy-1,4-benzoquinol methylase